MAPAAGASPPSTASWSRSRSRRRGLRSPPSRPDIDGPLVDWKAKGHRIELVGSAPLNGGEAYELKVTLKSGVVRHLWVDAASGLVVKTASTRTLRGHELQFETVYADYRKTDGVSFPRSIEMGVQGGHSG
jgi:hypothetical protein